MQYTEAQIDEYLADYISPSKEAIKSRLRLELERFRFSLIKRNTKQEKFSFPFKKNYARKN